MKNFYPDLSDELFERLGEIGREIDVAFWRGNFDQARTIVAKAERVRREALTTKRGGIESRLGDASQTQPPTTQPKKAEPMTNFEQALATLTDPSALEKLDEQIAEITSQLERLKTLRKALGGPSTSKRTNRKFKVDPDLERLVVSHIGTNGPARASDIGAALGHDKVVIGRLVASSDKLAKSATGEIILA